MYTSDDSLFRASGQQLTDSSADTLIATFEPAAGQPTQLSVSPDGARIALDLVTNSNTNSTTSTVWTIDADGTNAQQFARSQSGFQDRVGQPQWSPDGQWIVVAQETIAGGFNRPNEAGTQTALRADVTDHELGAESEVQINLKASCFRDPADCNDF